MGVVSSAVLNGMLDSMIVALSEGKLDDLTNIGKAYQRLKIVNVSGENANLVAELLNNLLTAMQKSIPEDVDRLSSTYQRVAAFELYKQVKH